MIRGAVVVACLVSAVCVVDGDDKDKDPVKENLFAAKLAYDAGVREYRKLVGEWFDKREDAARKDGNKKLVDQIKEERKAFDENRELPKSAPTAILQKQLGAKKALEEAYVQAVKDYVKAKKDTEAATVEAEWKAFVPENSIDLLALVAPKTHAVAGDWRKDGRTLIAYAGGKMTKLQLPYEPSEEYDLELICRRITGNDAVCVGLVAGDRQVAAVVDGWAGTDPRSAMDCVNAKSGMNNVTTVRGKRLKPDQDHTIVCSVRSGKIDLSVDGKVVTSFRGTFNHLSLSEGWGVPNKKALFLHTAVGTSFQFDRIVVTPVRGKGTILK